MSQDKLLRFFLRLNSNLKTYHWCTRSYSRHVTTDQTYEKIAQLADRFIEVYFGKYGRPSVKKEKHLPIEVIKMTDLEATLYLQQVVKYIIKHKSMFCPSQDQDSDLQSIVDEMIETMNRAIYLFNTTS